MRSTLSSCSVLIESASSAVSCDRRRSRIAEAWISVSAEARDELVARVLAVARRADELDDRVEVVERDQQALEHVHAALEHAQLVLRAAHDDLALVVDVVLDDLAQRQRPRHAVDERDHVDAERRLQRGVLVELVEDDLGDLVALERDDDPHAAALGGVVLEVGDPADLLLADELGDLHDEAVLAALLHGVRQLGDDERLAPAPDVLRVRLAAYAHAAAAGLVGVEDPLSAEDDAAGREVRARACAHQLGGGRRSSVGSSMKATTASMTSRRLCGGMFVAMPTAIPDEPLTSRFGKRAGSTTGSCLRPS